METAVREQIILDELRRTRELLDTLNRLYYDLVKSLLTEEELGEEEKEALKKAEGEGLIPLDELEG